MPMPIRKRTVERLAVLTFATEADAGRAAAERLAKIIRETVARMGKARVVFATGNSQLAFVRALAEQPEVPWSAVTVFHMDEYVGLSSDHPASFRRWINQNVVRPLGVGTVELLDGTAADEDAECRRYEALLKAAPLDVVCMGIGENGHLAFNEPGTTFDDTAWVRVITLNDRSRRQQVDEGHFASVAEVPPHAYSLTIPALLAADDLQVVTPERRKAKAVRDALTVPLSNACPATILREQPNAILFLDLDSAALLDEQTSATQPINPPAVEAQP